MAVFTKKTLDSGVVQYRNKTTGKLVKKEDLDELLLAKLDQFPEGTNVPEDSNIDDEGVEAPEVPKGETKVKITLSHPLLVNGQVYPGGREIEVSEVMAEDLLRIDSEHTTYETNLIRKQDFSRDAPRPQDIQ